jgi:UDPglucose--hexose-1-phosphate uridylyltransferase
MSELRWHPMLGQWVITATHRQDRTFFPPKDYCPLCPTQPGAFPTEIPAPEYDIAVFENKFPSLQHTPPSPAVGPTNLSPILPAGGVCEVVCYTSAHESTLAEQSLERIERLVDVWTDRTRELGKRDDVDYVFIFENKGREIGVTLPHPHGQIYGYPFIPPTIETELALAKSHFDKTGHNLIIDIAESEVADGRRILFSGEGFAGYIPFFARYPYEVHITARRPGAVRLDTMTISERKELAGAIQKVIVGYDRLFDISLPYIMVLHQGPTDGKAYDSLYNFHIEFYPPNRTKEKLKYLAGSEAGAGAYINDTLAEDKAAELRSKIG